jgi:hypothetical protein
MGGDLPQIVLELDVKLFNRGTAAVGYRTVGAMATRPVNVSAQAKRLRCRDE